MAITTMTLAKALVVAKAGLVAAAAAMALTACGPAPVAGVAVPAAVAAPAAPKALAPAAARRLLQAATSNGTLWGLDYRVSYHKVGEQKFHRPSYMEMRNGRVFWHKSKTWTAPVDYGWITDRTYSGDGELEDLTGGRFLYVVPEGRVLVINRVITPERVSINGYPLAGIAGDDVNFVFGPGESVLLGFPKGSSAGDKKACAAKVHGYTADPALLAGTGGAGIGAK